VTAYPDTTFAAGLAFDTIAEQYDAIFTETLIGRAQRSAVWNTVRQAFRAGDRVLELNCGTGEDAVFLAGMGVSVVACDASQRMVAVAAARVESEHIAERVRVEHCATERIAGVRDGVPFDGVFSNFSGLNCVDDLTEVARQLAPMVKPGGKLLFCLSSRICLWEVVWFLGRGEFRRAVRRWKGHAKASLGGVPVSVRYPTAGTVARCFAPMFQLKSCTGVGIAVPPSYLESVARRHPKLLERLQAADQRICRWPMFRSVGDHMLLALERTNA
jgi:ubiquinone/menaquinone biosynthesis C-methylase UbiE